MNFLTIPARRFAAAVGAAGLIAVCLAVPVAAWSDQSTAAIAASAANVSLADLDLTTTEGIAAARDRLQENARLLCAQQTDNLEPSHRVDFLSCVDRLLIQELKEFTSGARAAILAHDSAWPATAADYALGQLREKAPETSLIAVSIADLDLSSPQGALMARQRIHNTARRLCSQLTSSQGPASYYSHCVNDATAGALRQINDTAPGN